MLNGAARAMTRLLQRLFGNTGGDDLIEYALLVAFVALVSVVAWQLMGSNMNTAYRSWDQVQQDKWDLNESLPPTSAQ